MQDRNRSLTLKLDADLVRKLEIVATKRGVSVSALVLDALVELVDGARDYQQTKNRAVALLRQGFDLGTKGAVTESRGELHER